MWPCKHAQREVGVLHGSHIGFEFQTQHSECKTRRLAVSQNRRSLPSIMQRHVSVVSPQFQLATLV